MTLRPLFSPLAKPVAAGLLLGAGLLGLGACDRETDVPPQPTDAETGRDFVPLPLNYQWVYDVVDREWNYNVMDSVRFQFREVVDTVYTNAAGELTYRIVRARRAEGSPFWRDDSTFALNLTPRLLRRTFANLPTVELLFPVRPGATWNPNMFNAADSTERRYEDLDAPMTVSGRAYARTVRVVDAGEDNFFFLNRSETVYARGVGKIRHVRRTLDFCQLNDSLSSGGAGGCSLGPGYVVRGKERDIRLREHGPRP